MALNPLTYIKESGAELAKVIWPTRGQTARLTIVVIIGSVIVGLYISGLEFVLTKLTERLIK